MIQCDVTESAILGIWYRGHGTRLKDKKKFGITGFPTAINLSLLLFLMSVVVYLIVVPCERMTLVQSPHTGMLLWWPSGAFGSCCIESWWIKETLLTMRTLKVSRS